MKLSTWFAKLSRWLGILALPACSTQVVSQGEAIALRQELAARLQGKPEPAILFVGNSYSFDLPGGLARLAAERGRKIKTGHSTHSGWTLAKHAAHEPTLRKIRSGKWDVVVLQEHSLIPALPPRKRAGLMFPAVRALADEALLHEAVPVLFQTWGRRDGEPGVRGDDFPAMNRRIREGYAAAARDAGGIAVIPVGDAWEREMAAGRGDVLYLEDGSHPAAAGKALIAETFHLELFQP